MNKKRSHLLALSLLLKQGVDNNSHLFPPETVLNRDQRRWVEKQNRRGLRINKGTTKRESV